MKIVLTYLSKILYKNIIMNRFLLTKSAFEYKIITEL